MSVRGRPILPADFFTRQAALKAARVALKSIISGKPAVAKPAQQPTGPKPIHCDMTGHVFGAFECVEFAGNVRKGPLAHALPDVRTRTNARHPTRLYRARRHDAPDTGRRATCPSCTARYRLAIPARGRTRWASCEPDLANRRRETRLIDGGGGIQTWSRREAQCLSERPVAARQ